MKLTSLLVGLTLLGVQAAPRPAPVRFERVYPLQPDEGVFAYARISPSGRLLAYASEMPAGRRVKEFVQHMDFAPTIMNWAHAEAPARMEGKDFGPLAEGADTKPLWDRIVSCENTWMSKWAVRTESHKLILARRPDPYGFPRRELYDLENDPGETCNIAEQNPALADELEAWLENWIAEGLQRSGRETDPLCAQPLTLGKRWEEWAKRTEAP